MAKEIFNLQRLEQTLENFYKILNIRMSVFGPDEEELLPYPKQAPRFCRCIRRSPALAQGCRVCDKEVMRIARTMTEPYIYTCHAGLTEAVIAIRIEDRILGYIFLSHMLPSDGDPDLRERIVAQNARYGLPAEELRDALAGISVRSTEQIAAAAKVLEALAGYIHLKEIAKAWQKEDLAWQMQQYIRDHLGEELTCRHLCDVFHYSRTKLYETFTEAYGMGVSEYILMLRMQKAKQLLSDGEHIADVAAACGFSDYNYFFKVFRKRCGMTPKQFQDSARPEE